MAAHGSRQTETEPADDAPGGSDDPTQPLLHESWSSSRRMHYLLIALLVVLLLGGIVVGTWLIVISSSGGEGPPEVPFELVNRTFWGAKPPNHTVPFSIQPPEHVVIIHTMSTPCTTLTSCCKQIRIIQNLHMHSFNFSDIGYNFLVGGDGRTYEGRGWDNRAAFCPLMNKKALGIALIGDFEFSRPTAVQLGQVESLLKEAVAKNKLASDYKLIGHRQVCETDSPGDKLYKIIVSWPHWEGCYMTSC